MPSWVYDTRGTERLVVAPCAHKIKLGAGFHYKDNIVIVGTPVA